MSSQFLNGHQTGGPTPDMASHFGNPHLGQMIPEGISHLPHGSNVQGQYSAGPMMGKPFGGPPGSFNQSSNAWDPSLSRDSNGLPRGPFNSNQLSSEFGSMQISGRPGPPWSQAPNISPSYPSQPDERVQGHPLMTPSSSEASNSRIPAAQPPSSNAYPPQPPNSGVFQPQPPRPTYSQQSHSNAYMQPQPPTSQVFGSHPPSNFAPLAGFPSSERLQMSGPPMRGAITPPFGGPFSTGTVPTYTSSGPPQFPPGLISSNQEPPGGQWAPRQNVPTSYHDNSQHVTFSGPTSHPVLARPPPAFGNSGFPTTGYQGQRPRFPGALPDGSYSGAPGFPLGPPYLNHGNLAPQQTLVKRPNPDDMPSQIQVIENDKETRGGTYITGQRGSVPPFVTTDFFVEDQGTCSPRFFRATTYGIPYSGDLLRQTHVPAAVVITPFARLNPREIPPPIVDLGQMGPVRCNRCKAYMCPGMTFIDGGRKFQCCFCKGLTEVPPEYFNHLDHTGKRVDWCERPELHLGAYEFVAPVEYCQGEKLPQPPAFIFMIDVSYPSITSGLVNLLCTRLKKEILSNLPKDVGEDKSEVRVGFVTYAKELHFYNIKGNLSQPQMLVVSDVNDVFIPLVDGFLVKPSEAEVLIDSLMVQISQMFSGNQERETILGPVIQAGLDALKSSERVGKLFIFHCSMPSLEAPGKLKPREDKSLLGTDKEKNLLTPQNKFYTKLGRDCLIAGCSVDIFLFPTSYVDVATIAEVPRITGGSLYKYNNFQADLDGDMLMYDLRTNIERQVAFNVTLKLRTSTGIRPVDFLGNFHMENTTEVELASLDRDKCVTIEIKHDDKLNDEDGAIAQAVTLYTSIGGKRRMRILNMSFNCCTQFPDIFRSCELDVIINYLAKLSIRESLNSNTKQVKEQLTNRCVQTLLCYRKNCISPSTIPALDKFIMPDSLNLMPLYINSMLKSILFQSQNINLDDRSYYINLVNSMNVSETVAFFYPRLLPLHELDLNSDKLPIPIRCSKERLRENGAYLLENGLVMFLWVGLSINAEWIQQVFGVNSVAQVDIDKTKLRDFDNPLSVRVREIINTIRNERHRHMKLIILRQRDKLEPLMQSYLVEDKSTTTSSSLNYVDFICHVHFEIKELLI